MRDRAVGLGCETIQVFTRNPRGFKAVPVDPDEAAAFRRDIAESGISPVFVHAPYLVNLAAADARRSRMTEEILVSDAERCQRLGVRFLIAHVGRATGTDEGLALENVARNVNRILEGSPESVTLLLENTAGMGTEVGYTFEQIAGVLARVKTRDRVGVVLDTAHMFEAGYDLRTKAGLDRTLRQFDRTVGLSRLHLLHLNDSKTSLGSRKDRHWHIGKGEIGLEGFRLIVNHPLLSYLPGIMETPRKNVRDDLENMRVIRGLVRTDGQQSADNRQRT